MKCAQKSGSKDKESEKADRDADGGAADHVADVMNPCQHPGDTDHCRDDQHDDADLRLDIQERHRDDKGTDRMP